MPRSKEKIVYKLTTQSNKTRVGHINETTWGRNVTHYADSSRDNYLCSSQVIHCYEHPFLAEIGNPLHANIERPKLWVAKGTVVVRDNVKAGCKKLTTIKQIRWPKYTKADYIRLLMLLGWGFITRRDTKEDLRYDLFSQLKKKNWADVEKALKRIRRS